MNGNVGPCRAVKMGVAIVRCVLAITPAFAAACRSDRAVPVDFSRREQPRAVADVRTDVVRFGVAAMISPEDTYSSYVGFTSYLAGRVGLRAEMVQRRTYEEMNRILLGGEVDVAFVCTGGYVAIRDRVRLLAVPVVDGLSTYNSLIIARPSGPASLEALRGVRFAFTDPLSNTGRMYPIYLVRERFGLGPREFFGGVVYSGGHDESIRLVLRGAVAAAAVDHLVYDAVLRDRPEIADQLVVIHRSPPFGSPPFVARADLDPALFDGIRAALLDAHDDPSARDLLARMGIERFVPDADYSLAVEVARVALGVAPEDAAGPAGGEPVP